MYTVHLEKRVSIICSHWWALDTVASTDEIAPIMQRHCCINIASGSSSGKVAVFFSTYPIVDIGDKYEVWHSCIHIAQLPAMIAGSCSPGNVSASYAHTGEHWIQSPLQTRSHQQCEGITALALLVGVHLERWQHHTLTLDTHWIHFGYIHEQCEGIISIASGCLSGRMPISYTHSRTGPPLCSPNSSSGIHKLVHIPKTNNGTLHNVLIVK